MDSPFMRPEKPRELSRSEIIDQILSGVPVFCGKCHAPVPTYEPGPVFSVFLCGCHSHDLNLVGTLRIEQEKIMIDIIKVNNENFDPTIHIINTENKNRKQQAGEI